MAFWSNWFKSPEEKFSEAVALVHQQQLGRPAMTPRNYESLAKEGYQKNVIAFACVNKIAVATGSVRLGLFLDGTKIVEKIHLHFCVALNQLGGLTAKPNVHQ